MSQPSALEISEKGILIYNEDKYSVYVYQDCVYEFIYRDKFSEAYLPLTYDRYGPEHPKFDFLLEKYS